MKVRNNDYLREILNEIKELKEIARGFCKQPHILLDEYEKEQPEKRQCVQCEDEIIVKDGIIEADTFYCLPC
jgi:CRISPR/Cas system-associated protein Cas10 (large subunit of type III CRISPR-Cas system)